MNTKNGYNTKTDQKLVGTMTKPVTIEDLARITGVSPSTVSRVLNGNKGVAADKRALVLEAAEKHHYRPNAVARGLVSGRSMTIGVVVQDIATPFFANILVGIEQGLDQSGYRSMFVSTLWRESSPSDEEEPFHVLLDRRVDGLIVLAGQASDQYLLDLASHIPIIIAARKVEGLEDRCIAIDNVEGASKITRYLIGLGHNRIAHITGHRNHPDARDRLRGYQLALEEAGIEYDEHLVVEGSFHEESGQRGVEQLLTRGVRFSALFAGNDQTAYGAMLALSSHNFRIPNDVSVVGFDDVSLSAYTLPPLTTMRQPAIEMGRAAAEGMCALLSGNEPHIPHFPTELIIRKSAAIYH